jgi:hypothetical protein
MAEKLIWRGPGVLRLNGKKPKEVFYPDEEIPAGTLEYPAEISRMKKEGKIKNKTSAEEANERRKKVDKQRESAIAAKAKK